MNCIFEQLSKGRIQKKEPSFEMRRFALSFGEKDKGVSREQGT